MDQRKIFLTNKRILRRVIYVTLVVLLASAAFAPAIYKIGYRLTYGRDVRVAGVSFPIPWGWIGKSEADVAGEAGMVRVSNTVFSTTPDAAISIGQRHANKVNEAEFLQRWKEEGRTIFETSGYRVTGIKEFSDPEKVVCIEMNRNTGVSEVTCMFDLNRLTAEYTGDDSGVSDFYNIITSAHNSNTQ
jgi:hypothetical protein